MNFGSTAIKLNSVKSYNIKTNSSNNVFKNKFYTDSKIDNYNKYEDIDYNSLNLNSSIEKAKLEAEKDTWYKSAYKILKKIRDYQVTFTTSFTCGVLELVENVGDALIMCNGMVASSFVSIWDKELATDIKESAANAVKYDWTEALYEKAIEIQGVDKDIAHSWVHSAGSMIGTTAAYVAVSCIPGGAAVTASVGAVTALGSASEMALQSGANFDQAFSTGSIAAVAGAISGGALNKVQGLAGSAKTVAQVAGYSALGSAVAITEPVINTTSQYLIYGKDITDENGNKMYDNYFDYYNKSGGLLQTGIAAVVGGVSTGVKASKGYNTYNKNVNEFRRNKIYKVLKENGIPDSESKKISKALSKHYKNARKNANGKYKPTFFSYRDHGELHVIEVADYSKNMALRNIVLDEKSAKQVYFAGLLHDTGMENAKSILTEFDNKFNVNLADKSIDGVIVRKNHSLNSALIILSDDSLLPADIDKDIVAMLSLSHSKSTSGINSFKTKQQWLESIDILEKAANQNGLNFDANKIRDIINNDSTYAIFREQATCLRAGDSFSKVVVDANGNQIMQTSDSVILKNNNPRTNFNDIIKKDLETEMLDISDITTTGVEITDPKGKAYHIGESNVSFKDNYTGQDFFDVDVTFVDANNVPNASKMVIEERIGELKTFDHIKNRSVNIHLPEFANGSKLGDFYSEKFIGAGGPEVKINIIFDK